MPFYEFPIQIVLTVILDVYFQLPKQVAALVVVAGATKERDLVSKTRKLP